ncbi:MAG: hypothetical protein AAB573_03700 [Patescibacteria group bacterium]
MPSYEVADQRVFSQEYIQSLLTKYHIEPTFPIVVTKRSFEKVRGFYHGMKDGVMEVRTVSSRDVHQRNPKSIFVECLDIRELEPGSWPPPKNSVSSILKSVFDSLK